jgi:prepilin-type N-terminal cleavage/methylation domain-containing protein
VTTLSAQSKLRTTRKAFSLIELVIVVVIIGIVGAIAVPRVSGAAENAARAAVIADTASLQRAIDLYEIEHGGVLPHVGGGPPKNFYFRLLKTTDYDGTVNETDGIYGPYIDGIPINPYNGFGTIRLGGPAAGKNNDGWRYDTTSGIIEPDHTAGTTSYKVNSGTVRGKTNKLINAIDD